MSAKAGVSTGERDIRRLAFRGFDCGEEGVCPTAHRGLLLDKFVKNFEKGEANARQRLLEQVCAREWTEAKDPFYTAAFARWRSIWVDRPEVRTLETVLNAPLAIGLGAKGAMDGGIRLHRTYGLPLIPGSGVRGAVSSFVDQTLGIEQPESWSAGRRGAAGQHGATQGALHRLLFGTTTQAGRIAFEDAWWVPDNGTAPLCRDTITPHHQAYYTGGAPRQEPAETDDPVPVAIPVVPTGAKFLFIAHWRARPDDAGADIAGWLALAAELLEQALAQQGVGGKRSQGYGTLVVDPEAQARARSREQLRARREEDARREAEQKAMLEAITDPIERQFEEIRRQTGEGDPGRALVKALSAGKWQGEERRRAAQLIRAQREKAGIWKETTAKKNPLKDWEFQDTLVVLEILKGA